MVHVLWARGWKWGQHNTPREFVHLFHTDWPHLNAHLVHWLTIVSKYLCPLPNGGIFGPIQSMIITLKGMYAFKVIGTNQRKLRGVLIGCLNILRRHDWLFKRAAQFPRISTVIVGQKRYTEFFLFFAQLTWHHVHRHKYTKSIQSIDRPIYWKQ